MINSVISEFFSSEGPTVNPQYQPQHKCICGEPSSSGVHRSDGPCIAKQWIGLTADEMEGLYQTATYMDETDYIHMLMMAEEKLKEKNHG